LGESDNLAEHIHRGVRGSVGRAPLAVGTRRE